MFKAYCCLFPSTSFDMTIGIIQTSTELALQCLEHHVNREHIGHRAKLELPRKIILKPFPQSRFLSLIVGVLIVACCVQNASMCVCVCSNNEGNLFWGLLQREARGRTPPLGVSLSRHMAQALGPEAFSLKTGLMLPPGKETIQCVADSDEVRGHGCFFFSEGSLSVF